MCWTKMCLSEKRFPTLKLNLLASTPALDDIHSIRNNMASVLLYLPFDAFFYWIISILKILLNYHYILQIKVRMHSSIFISSFCFYYYKVFLIICINIPIYIIYVCNTKWDMFFFLFWIIKNDRKASLGEYSKL